MKTINKKIKIAALTVLITIPLLMVSLKTFAGTGAQAVIDQELCIGCRACVEVLPEYIEINENGKAQFTGEVPIEYATELINCVSVCPVNAISIVGTN
jgi:ferredoxin